MPHHLLPQRHSPSSARARKGPKYAHFEKKVQNLRILSPPFGIVFPGAMSQKWPPADIPPQVVASEKGRFLSGLRELLNNRKKRKSDLRPAKESNIKKAARAGRRCRIILFRYTLPMSSVRAFFAQTEKIINPSV